MLVLPSLLLRLVRYNQTLFRCGLGALLAACLLQGTASAGTWKRVTTTNPQFYNGTMMLLTDGTVMVESGWDNQSWTKLTPDSTGSYVNGTWSNMAKMSRARLYFGSNVLTDGRVFVLGGEYSGPNLNQNFTNTGEIYDPATNKWSPISPFPQSEFGDDPTALMPDGTVLAGYISGPETYFYYPQYDFWFNGPTKLRNDASDEETWLTLPGYQVLSYDIFASDTLGEGHAQKYDYFSDSWLDAGDVPVLLTSSTQGYELGPGAVLPNGTVIQIGANENTAIYTMPVDNTQPGTWTAGPTLPAGMGADDAPGAMLPDGHFLFLADFYLFNSPTYLFDYNYQTNTLTDLTPTLPAQLQNELYNASAYTCRMLVLPNGAMLLHTGGYNIWEYTPSGTPLNTWRPTISSVTKLNSKSYRVVGARLTGISEGATYGDDAEMSTNYPIIKLTQVGVAKYAKSYNWTPMISKPGDTGLQTVDFDLPPGLTPGTYYVAVIANGISSLSTPITVARSNTIASFSNGTLSISGDADSNNITMTYKQVKVSGVLKSASVTITANDIYSTVNGLPSVTIDVGIDRFSANIQMGAGDDNVTVNSFFAKNLLVNGSDGDDTVTLVYNSVSASLYVDGGTGFDTVTLTGNSIAKQTIVNVP